jgi:hypothetical protein
VYAQEKKRRHDMKVHRGRISKAGIERKKEVEEEKITPSRKPLLEKPAVTKPVQQFYAVIETQRIITAFTRALQVLPVLGQMNPVHAFLPYFFNIHFILFCHHAEIFL